YPHELSGGELQRVMIALAITQEVELIIADEPTSALDLLWQKRILEQFQAIQESRSLSLLFVSHDLAAIAHLADRILVMHQGREVECAPTQEIFSRPTHPQTQKLIQDRQLLLQGLHP
ncbi:MAG TPA: ABC transporter ATP-binding protein, partial [Helicobacter sp.]|nr:ABC transporter ATP-binding protein [Helicobacter sp.]